MKQKFYAVKNGRHIGIYNTWEECEKEVKGFLGAKFKSFFSREEADFYINGENLKTKKNNEDDSDFLIYTDGSCLKNPGPGGWAAVITDKRTGEIMEISGGEKNTTNNRMELSAALYAIKNTEENAKITLITDSEYLKNAFTKNWLLSWQKNNWKTSQNTEVKNRDLWEKLLEGTKRRKVFFKWVKGHAGQKENERCDFLAKKAAKNN